MGSSRLPPGLVWFIPWLDAIQTVDLCTMFFNIWPQEVSSILWSLKAGTHWPLFPYKDHICVHLPAQNQLLFFHNNSLKLFVSAHWCFVTSPCLLLSPGLDCGCSAVVFFSLHVGDACCKRPPGRVLAGPDGSWCSFHIYPDWDRMDLLIHRCWVCISSGFVALCTSYHHKGVQLSLGWFQEEFTCECHLYFT